MLSYTVKIDHSYLFTKMLTGQWQGRKYKQGNKTSRTLGNEAEMWLPIRHREKNMRMPYWATIPSNVTKLDKNYGLI